MGMDSYGFNPGTGKVKRGYFEGEAPAKNHNTITAGYALEICCIYSGGPLNCILIEFH